MLADAVIWVGLGHHHAVLQAIHAGLQQFQTLTRLHLRRDVLQGSHQANHLAIGPHSAPLRSHPNPLASGGIKRQHKVPGCTVLPGNPHGLQHLGTAAFRVGIEGVPRRPRGPRLQAVDPAGLFGIDQSMVMYRPFPAADAGHFARAREHVQAVVERLLCSLANRNVLHHARATEFSAVARRVASPDLMYPAHGPRACDHAVLCFKLAAVEPGGLLPGLVVSPVIRMHDIDKSVMAAVKRGAVHVKQLINFV